MIFQRIVYLSLVVGLVAGLALSLVQVTAINPIIFHAESFEVAEVSGHDHASHDHSAEAWAPEDGAERTGYTLLSNVSAGIGFSAILLAIMCQMQSMGVTRLSMMKGVLWGLAGFTAFFVAPGIGLPPEIPGIEAPPIANRQVWWLFTVVCVGVGLLIISFATAMHKLIGGALIVLPYIAPVPHHEGAAFAHPDPAAVKTLHELHEQFIIASGAGNLLFWLVMGVVSAYVLNRWVLKETVAQDRAAS